MVPSGSLLEPALSVAGAPTIAGALFTANPATGALFSIVIVSVKMLVAPRSSVTFSVMSRIPENGNCTTEIGLPAASSSNVPSLFRSHWYRTTVPSGSLEPVALSVVSERDWTSTGETLNVPIGACVTGMPTTTSSLFPAASVTRRPTGWMPLAKFAVVVGVAPVLRS